MVLPICWMMTGASPRSARRAGGAVRGAQDAADREHLLLAAGKLCARTVQALLEGSGTARRCVEIEPPDRTLGAAAGSLDIEALQKCHAPPTKRQPEPGDPVTGQSDDLVALVAHRPGAPADDPHDGLECRGLPAPLRPSSVTTSPERNLERDAVQHVGFAVPGLQPVEPQERRFTSAPLPKFVTPSPQPPTRTSEAKGH